MISKEFSGGVLIGICVALLFVMIIRFIEYLYT